MRPLRLLLVGVLSLAAATSACSAVLGLDPPPSQSDGGGVGSGDATTPVEASAEASSDSPAGDGGPPVTCAALGADDAGYLPLTPTTVDDAGTSSWQLFNVGPVPSIGTQGYVGGTFDGRYLYFAGNGFKIARYDTRGAFDDPAAWTGYAPAPATAFAGAAFDGRYAYFVPNGRSGTAVGIVARYDTLGSFSSAASWTTFDVSTLSDAGAPLLGFYGAAFDGRYVFLVPHNDGQPHGRVLRYDVSASVDAAAPGDAAPAGGGEGGADGGDGGGAGDAAIPGVTGTFQDPSLWTSFDVSAVNVAAKGYAGAVLAKGNLLLVPDVNGAFDGAVHGGNSSIVVEHAMSGPFGAASAWSAFDTTTLDGLATSFIGAAYDGRYVYLVPRASGVVVRLDATASLSSTSAWSVYDTTRVATLEGGAPEFYAGGAFDGRFIYLVPDSRGGVVTRYDTQSPFTADCAWSTFDPSQLPGSAGGSVTPFTGAVFDGEYVYFVPASGPAPVFARFKARPAGPLPAIPDFHGSFL